jgi:glucose/arabinose dehydrogenase/DNA-binding beta-propeller fold protein YncE
MQWRRAAATLGLACAGLVLAQGGCAPGAGPPASSVEESTAPSGASHSLAPEAVDSPAPAPTENPVFETVDSPTPESSVTAVPAAPVAATPGGKATPTPARATAKPTATPIPPTPTRAPAASPTNQTPAEVVAVTLATGNKIALIDPATGKVGRMVDVSLPRGKMAIAPDGRSAWALGAQGRRSSVALFDVLSGDRHEDLQLRDGDAPAAVAFSTDGTRAYVAMAGDGTSQTAASTIVFMTAGGREFGRVSVGRQTRGVQIRRQLSSLAIAPGANGDVLYAAGEASGVVWALDANSGAVLNEIEVGGGPTSVVTDPARQRAYVLLDTLNQVVAIDTTTFAIVNRLALPARPIGAAVRPDGTVFITGGDTAGEVWVVEPGATELRSRVPIGGQPIGLALSADSKSFYIPDSASTTLSVVSADTVQVTRTIPLGSAPLDVVAAYGSAQRQREALTPSPAVDASARSTPSLVPTPTPLPDGVRLPDQLPAGAVAEPFISGADMPVALAFAPDGRLFYNELRTGKIRIIQNGALLPDPFYQFLISDQPEAGLMGLTLDPDFARNHYVYALFTSVAADANASARATGPNEVVRLTDVGNKGIDVTPVLQDLPSATNHNAGTLRFGPDGKLYVSLGDDDQASSAQDLSTLAGKILRVNPDGTTPDDNPFVGDTTRQGAIWAYGLHNAYSFAFHPVGQKLLAVEDGAGDSDELELVVRGANYGSPASGYSVKPGVNVPIAVMTPAIRPRGSTFYTGDQLPDWKNDWFYCNSDRGELRRVRLAPGSFDRIVFEEVVKPGCSYDVVTGPDGALYYSDAKGIYRIRRSDAEVLTAVKLAAPDAPAAVPAPGSG